MFIPRTTKTNTPFRVVHSKTRQRMYIAYSNILHFISELSEQLDKSQLYLPISILSVVYNIVI